MVAARADFDKTIMTSDVIPVGIKDNVKQNTTVNF